MLTIVAYAFIKVVTFFPCHDQIVVGITELTVFGQRSLESFWLVTYQLDMKTTHLIDFCYLFLQPLGNILCQRLTFVSPHTMPGFNGFL